MSVQKRKQSQKANVRSKKNTRDPRGEKGVLPQVGVFAPSSKVADVEFDLGIEKLRESGFEVQVHPHCYKSWRFFAGTDTERAESFIQFAKNPEIQILWCARGGSGAARLLPLLDRAFPRGKKPPRKLLVGYSDSTTLLEYVRVKWGWDAIHAPMPGLRKFCVLPPAEWEATLEWIRDWAGVSQSASSRLKNSVFRLEKIGGPDFRGTIRAPIVGGNLTVWTSLLGTPYAGQAKGKVLFLEDVDEGLYRIDRMMQQLLQSGGLRGVKAIVLGNFQNCRDSVPQVLAPGVRTRLPTSEAARVRLLNSPEPKELAPLRPILESEATLREIFSEVGREASIPVFWGLPVGHGPERFPLPLGAVGEITTPKGQGKFRIAKWPNLS